MVAGANFVEITVFVWVRLIDLKPIYSTLLKVAEHQLTEEMKPAKDGINVSSAQKLMI